MIDDFKQVARPARPQGSELPKPVERGSAPTIIRPMQPGGASSGFRTPEAVAADSLASPAAPTGGTSSAAISGFGATKLADDELPLPAHTSAAKPAGATITLFKKWTVSKKKFIIASAGLALLLVGGGTAFAVSQGGEAPKPTVAAKVATPTPTPTPAPILSPLTGMTTTKDKQVLPVIGVMIENSPDARPQSGLKEAGVVYEAIAEAGITRFLALFQEDHPGNVGPVRSSRPYYLDWAMGFDAAYAHVGGSPDALQRIKDIGVRDMDQFYNPAAFRRITTRYAPHNVYTSIDQLTDLAKSKGYETSTFTSFARKADKPYVAPAAATPAPAASSTSPTSKSTSTSPKATSETRAAANSIDLGISSTYYNAHYDYDAASNSYKRSEGGEAHLDFESKTQLAPKVVISLVIPYSIMADGYHSAYATQGTGKMYVFQDGTVVTGTWTKGDPKSNFEFKDDAGKIIQLNAGQTWISVVGDAGKVTYK